MDNITVLKASLSHWRIALDAVRDALDLPISRNRDSLLSLAQTYNAATYAVGDAVMETIKANVTGFTRSNFVVIEIICGEVREIVEDRIIRYLNHTRNSRDGQLPRDRQFNPILAVGDAQSVLMHLEDKIMVIVEDIASVVDGLNRDPFSTIVESFEYQPGDFIEDAMLDQFQPDAFLD